MQFLLALSATPRSWNMASLVAISAAVAVLFYTAPVFAAGSGIGTAAGGGTGKPVLMLTPSTSNAEMAKLGDNDVIELQDGRQLKMGTVRKFSAIAQKLKAARGTKPAIPPAVMIKPAATGLKVTSMADLSRIFETSPDDTTIEFSSGRTYTVAQLRYLKPFLDVETGRKLDLPGVQSKYQKSAIKIKNTTDKEYWQNILRKPDDTLLETPQGKRFTVGDLKAAASSLSSANGSGGEK